MASSGSFNTSAYDGRYYTFSWTATQNASENTSTINWTLSAVGGKSSWYAERTLKVIVAGKTVFNKTDRVERKVGTITSGSETVTHNSDGSKSFSASIQAAVFTSSINCTGSQTFSLNALSVKRATISGASNFTDEDNPTVSYSNPSGRAVDALNICILDTDGNKLVDYKPTSRSVNSYTFNFSEAERDVLRNACKNSKTMTVKFCLRTQMGSKYEYDVMTKTLTIINANPVIGGTWSVVDTDAAMTALTGSNTKLVKYISDAKITFGTVTASKKATIKEKKVICGSQSIGTSGSTITNITSNTFTVSATDSRGNTATKTITPTMVNYVKLTCNFKPSNPTTDGNMSFEISGNYFNGSFGAVTNTLTVQYRWKVEGGTYSAWTALTPTLSGNSYSAESSLTGLDYQTTYIFQCRAIDKVYTSGVTTAERKVKSSPVFDWGANDFNVNVPLTYRGEKLFYTSGDSVSFTVAAAFGGVVTNTAKELYFQIPLAKPCLANGVKLSGAVLGRGINGYVNGTSFGDSTSISMGGGSGYTVTASLNGAGVYVKVVFASAVANAVNNTPVNFLPYGSLTITFT